MEKTKERTATGAPSEVELTKLLAEYYELIQNESHREGDCHWRIAERFSYGERVGWFVEHDGDIYQLDDLYGVDGPHPSREAAVGRMIEHLHAAIVEVRSWQGG